MKKIKVIISILLCFVIGTLATMGCVAFDDDPFTFIKTSSAEAVTEYTHADKFKTGYDIYDMIDVSHYDETIDWQKVKADGVGYAMVRVGYRGYSEGNIKADTMYKKYIEDATAAGVKVGVYFYSQAITRAEALEEANFVIDAISGFNLPMPVVFDLEYASTGSKETGRLYKAKLSKNELTAICLTFLNKIQNSGYEAMLYANPNILINAVNVEDIAPYYNIWLAHYTNATTYSGDYTMWQYGTGTVNGISAKVDKNFYYVKKSDTPTPDYIKITSPKGQFTVGDMENINIFKDEAAISALDGTVSETKWTSSNTNVATVNNVGLVTAVSVGTATITAEITVTKSVEGEEDTVSTYKDSIVIETKAKPVTPPVEDEEDDSDNQNGSNNGSGILATIMSIFAMIIEAIINILKNFT